VTRVALRPLHDVVSLTRSHVRELTIVTVLCARGANPGGGIAIPRIYRAAYGRATPAPSARGARSSRGSRCARFTAALAVGKLTVAATLRPRAALGGPTRRRADRR